MGVMSQILQSEPRKKIAPAEPPKSVEQPACKICGGLNFWESIYLDGTLRCETCEPAPTPDMVGRWSGPAAELLQQANRAEPQSEPGEHYEPGTDPADRFVDYVTADGRKGLALRGFDNPRHANYNQRVCMYVAIGVTETEQRLDELQSEWRTEILQ